MQSDLSRLAALSQNILASQRLSPRLRNLTQVINATKKLTQKPEPTAELAAHMFFASKNIDMGRHAAAMQALQAAVAHEASEPSEDVDIDSFLEHQHEMLISSSVEECSRINARALTQQYSCETEAAWAAAKAEILESMDFHMADLLSMDHTSSSAHPALPVPSLPSSSAPSSTSLPLPPVSVSLSPAQLAELSAYAQVISALSVTRLERHQAAPHTHFPLAVYLCEAANVAEAKAYDARTASSSAGAGLDEHVWLPPSDVHDMWSLLLAMVSVGPSAAAVANIAAADDASAGEGALMPYQTHPLLLPTPSQALARALSPHKLRLRLAAGAREYAEAAFEEHVRSVLAQTPSLQAVGARHQASQTDCWDKISAEPGDIKAIVADIEAFALSTDFRAKLSSAHASVAEAATRAGEPVPAPASASSPWARVHLLLRVGAVAAAAAYAKEHLPQAPALSAALRARAGALVRKGKALAGAAAAARDDEAMDREDVSEDNDEDDEGLLPEDVWRALVDEFATITDSAPHYGNRSIIDEDPFCVSLYMLLGRIHPPAHVNHLLLAPYLHSTIEDYMWQKLFALWDRPRALPEWLLSNVGITQAEGCGLFSLKRLQNHVNKLGEAHFTEGGTSPLAYVKTLIMVQDFEQAAAALGRVAPMVGANFVIALAHYNIIKCSPPTAPLLTPLPAAPSQPRSSAAAAASSSSSGCGSGSSYAVNGALLIKRFVAPFTGTNPDIAFCYLHQLRTLPVAENAAAVGATGVLPSLMSQSSAASAAAAAAVAANRPSDDVDSAVMAAATAAIAASPVASNATISSRGSIGGMAVWPDPAALGLDKSSLVQLLLHTLPASATLLISDESSQWSPINPHDPRGLIPSWYPFSAVRTLLLSTATELNSRGRSHDAAQLLARAGEPEAAGEVVLQEAVGALVVAYGRSNGGNSSASSDSSVKAAIATARSFLALFPASTGTGASGDGTVEGVSSAISAAVASSIFLAEASAGPSRTQSALIALERLNLFPLSTSSSAAAAAGARVSALPQPLRRLLPLLVGEAGQVLSKAFTLAASAAKAGATGAAEEVGRVREKARALASFILSRELDRVPKEIRLEISRLEALVA